jgi:predicted phosphodiesterase
VRLGLLSDVHGNRTALDAVLAHGQSCGVDEWWVLGDLVAIGADPVETLDALSALPRARCLRGNTDRYVISGDRPFPGRADVARDPALQPLFDEVEASFAWTASRLDEAGCLGWLADLPSSLEQALPDGSHLVGVHASPTSDDGRGITPDASEADLQGMLEASRADLLVGGHTHRPTDRALGRGRVVNTGSVSNPITDDLRASYVVLDADGPRPRLRFHRVSYDHQLAASRITRSGHPAAAYVRSFQTGGQVRHRSHEPGSPSWG